jgi:inward rectifier potassium channel
MAKQNRFEPTTRQASQEVGFGNISPVNQRLMNADGSYNYVRIGLPWYESFNIYHFFITSSIFNFILIVFLWYTVMNLLFTGLYYGAGVENLTGMVFKNEFERFMEVYFFSAQTLTTVGYGRINPMGVVSSIVASLEALVGLLSFAVFTGLVYARFAKPKASLMFSKNAIIAPFNDMTALMFRFANKTKSNLMNMKVQVTLSLLEVDSNGIETRKFFTPLNLERDSIVFFPSSWTIVHPIDQKSPLNGMTWEALSKAQPELLILISGFDDTFDDNVHERHSYDCNDIVWGAKFVKVFSSDTEGRPIVNLALLDKYDDVQINHLISKDDYEAENSAS